MALEAVILSYEDQESIKDTISEEVQDDVMNNYNSLFEVVDEVGMIDFITNYLNNNPVFKAYK